MRLLALGSFPKIIPVATLSTCLPPYLPSNSMFSVLGFQRRFVVTVILSGSPCGQDTGICSRLLLGWDTSFVLYWLARTCKAVTSLALAAVCEGNSGRVHRWNYALQGPCPCHWPSGHACRAEATRCYLDCEMGCWAFLVIVIELYVHSICLGTLGGFILLWNSPWAAPYVSREKVICCNDCAVCQEGEKQSFKCSCTPRKNRLWLTGSKDCTYHS